MGGKKTTGSMIMDGLGSAVSGILNLLGLKESIPDTSLIVRILKTMSLIDLTTLMSMIIIMIIFKNHGANIGGPIAASELYLIMLMTVAISGVLIFPLSVFLAFFVKEKKYRGLIYQRLVVYSVIGTLMTFLVIPSTIPKFIDEHLVGFIGTLMMGYNSFFSVMIWVSISLWAHTLYKKEE